ncbi:glycosyltransferase family 2 protein [Frigidibacter sp. MR17.24]|uniref:glycosyltransferase family 2 protein n=1 Tax=Frigidibacter sp. MR17.24 TaxID=3127345 RepID=UPI003012DD6A
MSLINSRGMFLGSAAAAFCAPAAALPFAAVCFGLQGALAALHLAAFATRPSQTGQSSSSKVTDLFFSVHIAAHDEPPELVLATLRTLACQVDAPSFEVIVLDNNTVEVDRWQPVQEACRSLGFRFYHEMGVQGAKAGALNIALQRTSRAATHVVILDADYQVDARFLSRAALALRDLPSDFLQFPQAYRQAEGAAAGLALELADYFERHARQADGADAMLLTGTLSVIRYDALAEVGGWSSASLTEDAELGLRLQRSGYRGRLVDEVVGRGLLPLDLPGLKQQRYRWAAGNITTLLSSLTGLPARKALHVGSQLTAWSNFSLPLAAMLIGGGLAAALGDASPSLIALLSIASAGMLIVYLSTLLPLLRPALQKESVGKGTMAAALATRVAMILPSAQGTIDGILGTAGQFRRTSKDAKPLAGAVDLTLPFLAVCGLVLICAPDVPAFAKLAAILLALPLPLSIATQAMLSDYRISIQPE